jgi:conjugal transfer mating pair stabilization protein TraG
MQFQIITFGNGEILKGVLDAIAMCLNARTGTLYVPMLRVGMMVAVLWMAIYSIWGDYLKVWGKGLIPFVFIPPLLFAPSATVYIHDPVTHYRDKVDHVPIGLAWLGHFVSQFGYEITKQVDQVFAHVDDLKYHKSGFLMASNLIQQAKAFRIVNEDVAENMRQFVCQCVAYEAMLGYKYTFEDLRHDADLWGLVSSNPSKIRSFVWREPHKKDEPSTPPQIISCKEGVNRFNHLWGSELNRAKEVFGVKLFGSRNPINTKQEFLKYLPLSYGFLSGLSKSADQILKQHMMIHSIVDGIEQKSLSLGNAPNFAAKRGYLQQRATYETLGAMASESLLTMKAVLEAIAYAAFIFIVPLAVLPFGVRILLSWAQTLLWLQMWAPLYAVLNFIMSMTAQSKSMGMLSVSNPEGITIASSVGIMNLNADISAMAGFLAMSVPFLAIALVKGVGSFVHMASHLGNVSQGAASQAAGEAVTGNYSFGNVSTGNEQIANSNMLSQSRAATYRAGSFQMMDGRMDMTTMGDGSQVVNIGASNLPVNPNVAETQSAQYSEMATRSYQNALNRSQSSAESLSDSYRNMVTLSDNLAKSESMNDAATQGVTAEQSQNIHKGAQLLNSFADENHMNASKAADLFAEASVGGGLIWKGAVGGKASISASDQELLQKAQRYMTEHNFQDAARASAQSAKNLSHTLSNEASQKLATDISGSYEKGMSERAEAAKSFSESDAWNQQAMNTRANAAAINANYSQQYFEWLANQPADNAVGRIGERGAAYMVANKPTEAMAYANKFMAQNGLLPKAPLHTNPQQIKNDYEADTRHQVYTVTQNPVNTLKNQASSIFNTDLSTQGERFRESTSQAIDANGQKISQSTANLSQEGAEIEQKVAHEQGRYVTKKVVEKAAKETQGVLQDIDNFEKQNLDQRLNDLRKANGKPQQK